MRAGLRQNLFARFYVNTPVVGRPSEAYLGVREIKRITFVSTKLVIPDRIPRAFQLLFMSAAYSGCDMKLSPLMQWKHNAEQIKTYKERVAALREISTSISSETGAASSANGGAPATFGPAATHSGNQTPGQSPYNTQHS